MSLRYASCFFVVAALAVAGCSSDSAGPSADGAGGTTAAAGAPGEGGAAEAGQGGGGATAGSAGEGGGGEGGISGSAGAAGEGGSGGAAHPLLKGDAACPASAPSDPTCSVDGASCVYQGIEYGLDVSAMPFRCDCHGTTWACVQSDANGDTECPIVTHPGAGDPCPSSSAQPCVYAFAGSPSFGSCSCDANAGAAGNGGWVCAL